MTDDDNEPNRHKEAGRARTDAMSPAERKALASKAAHARWKLQKSKVLNATHQGAWELGPARIYCAVLEDGRRVFSERSLSDAFGHVRSGGEFKKRKDSPEDEHLPVMISPGVADYLSAETRKKLAKPIRYNGGGIPARGVDAELLPEICDAFLAAREAGSLTSESSLRKAQSAERILRGLAKVGVVALIDEVTGFQFERKKDELRQLLEKYVSQEYRSWSRMFPSEFYQEIFRLKGKKLDAAKNNPQWVGNVTNNIIYDRILPGMRNRLCEVNPANEDGNRSRRHHQHIADGDAIKHLERHIQNVILLMKSSRDWNDFIAGLDRALPKRSDEEVA